MKGPIVVVGSSNTDMVIRARRLPLLGETVLGHQFVMVPGGKGANQAVAAARLGGRVQFVGRFGRDIFGEGAIAHLKDEGVGTDYTAYDEGMPSGIALIVVDERGENSIVVAPGANGRLSVADVERAGPAIGEANLVLAQLEVPLEAVRRAMEMAQEAGATIILDPAPAQDLETSFLEKVDIITPNEIEAAVLTGVAVTDLAGAEAAAKALLARGPETVIITLGERGALLVTAEGSELIPGYPVRVVDTTAAGDAFSGGLALALAEGFGLREAVSFANAAGALTVTKLGAQPSLPTREEVIGLYSKRPKP